MKFCKNHIYYIFNRDNNSRRLFFTRNNYLLFLSKIYTYITPFADILAWCLMPNHFHMMVYVNEDELEVDTFEREQVLRNQLLIRRRSLNDSISIMLRSYTRAVQYGNLFRQNTKAICLTETTGFTSVWFQLRYGTIINTIEPGKEYPQICFNYIHQNPVNEGLVNSAEEWEYSSYLYYLGMRNGKIFSRERVAELGLHVF